MRTQRGKGAMRRTVVGLLATGMMLMAVPAHAGSPQPTEQSVVVDNCGFDVLIEIAGKEKIIDFGNRVKIIAPGQKATMTNLATGVSVRKNVSGPATITNTPTGDGGLLSTFKGTGNWLHLRPGEIWHTSGLWVQSVVVDPNGMPTDFEEDFSRSHIVDICQTLS